MATRVYELSKKYDISNKDLLKLLNDEGFSVTSHISAVVPEAIDFLEKKFSKSKKTKELPPKAEAAKKIVPKESKAVKPSKEMPEEIVEKIIEKKAEKKIDTQKIITPKEKLEVPTQGIVVAPMSVMEFAQKTEKPVSDVILTLIRNKIIATKNQILSEKIVAQLAEIYNLEILKAPTAQVKQEEKIITPKKGVFVQRLPIVVVIGHVDHGKTTLLDFIRKTRVAAKEKGGITQHLGAYEVKTSVGGVVFLDTPGHEAFSMMRVRGLKIADIAILIVAADDGVMPQTIESIKHAQAVGLPIIVAINKIDKATSAQIENVKKQLSQHSLVPEDWGGQTVCMPISAKVGTGISELLDVISLQAQLMELTADSSGPAKGYVLESKLEKGRGFVATVICQHGILKIGDYFKAGSVSGKVSSLVDSYGKRVLSVEPSHPVLVAGFSGHAQAGDIFEVISAQESRKTILPEEIRSVSMTTRSEDKQVLNVIIKTDNTSSREALLASINKISSKFENKINILHAAIGNISESDILLAANTGAIIYGLHTKTESNAVLLAQKNKVKIKHFDIIYKLLEDLESELESNKPVVMVSKKIGEAIVLKVFDIKNLGVIAGAQVKTGRCTRDSKVVIYRDKQKIGEGPIKSLQRERKSVKEVHAGFECAFLIDKFTDWQVDDRVECYLDVPA